MKSTLRNTISAIGGILLVAGLVVFQACAKPPGPGGKASITGRVYATDFDNTQRYILSQDFAAGERVYITYGNSNEIGDDVRTGPDGSFYFKFLTKGKYRIFVNSLDTSQKLKGNDTYIPVIHDVEITDAKGEVDVGIIKINL